MKTYRVTVITPDNKSSKIINWNISEEKAIEQVKLLLGMEQPAEWVNSCTFPLVEEVMRDPNNKFGFIPVF